MSNQSGHPGSSFVIPYNSGERTGMIVTLLLVAIL
jgi:hypothetical protein